MATSNKTVRIPNELWERGQVLARKRGTTLSALIVKAVQAFVDKNEA